MFAQQAAAEQLPPHAAGFQNAREVPEPLQLKVLGRVPEWLNGALIRPGPGTFDIAVEDAKSSKAATYTFRHMFDAPAVVHKFDIAGGRITYRNCKLNKGTEAHIQRTGQLPEFETAGTFAEPPGSGLMSRAFAGMAGKLRKTAKPEVAEAIAKAQSNLVTTMQGKLVATTMEMVELDPVTVQPLRRFAYKDLSPSFKGELSCGTPIRDMEARETLSFTLQFVNGTTPLYRICVIPDHGEPYVLHEYGTGEDFLHLHSFAVTPHYVVMMHWPAVIKPIKLVVGQKLLDALSWEPDKGTKFLVFDRRRNGAGLVATYRSEAFYVFHQVNAFEVGSGNIAIDIMAFPDIAVATMFEVKHLRQGQRPFDRAALTRYMLDDVKGGSAPTAVRQISGRSMVSTPSGFEMPRIDARRRGQQYRFCYCLSVPEGAPWFGGICKLDVSTGRVAAPWAPAHHFPGEAVFVPRPGGHAEDDGVLLSVVLDGATRCSLLVIVDATTFTEVARAQLPFAVPYSFQGNFFDASGAFSTEC